jgi:uncharacterized protein YbjT (DUF2867 family)
VRILVLGASGGCGRWLTRLAAAEGHAVTAMVRPTTPFDAPAGVTVHRGNALDRSHLAAALTGQDALVSCIGPQRVNPKNPWSPLRPPLHVAELSARTIVGATRDAGVRRVATISAAGVGESVGRTNALMRWLIARSTIGAMYADLAAMEDVLRGSDLDWLAVRPVVLIDAPPSGRTRVLSAFRAHSVVGRADVAAWLLRSFTGPAPTTDRTPMIGWW